MVGQLVRGVKVQFVLVIGSLKLKSKDPIEVGPGSFFVIHG